MENLYPLLNHKYIFRQSAGDREPGSRLIALGGGEIELNEASERVVIECDGGRSVKEIGSELARVFDQTEPQTILTRLQSLLSVLRDQGAIELLTEPVRGKRRRILPKQPPGTYPLVNLFLEVTNGCNLKCIHCYLGDIDQRRELPLKDIERVLDQFAAIGGESLTISGGEPFFRKDLLEIVEFASSLPLFVSILSNGVLITPEAAQRLSRYNVREVQISLDGARPQTHDAYRGLRGAHAAAIRAIETLRREGVGVDIATVVNRLNKDELTDLIDFCQKWDIVPGLSHQQRKGRATGAGQECQLTHHEHFREMIRARRYITENTKDRPFTFKVPAEPDLKAHRCSAGLNSLTVRSSGEVFACLDLISPAAKLGNIYEQSIDEIWNSDNEFLGLLRASTLQDLTFCRDCRHFLYCKGGCPAAAFEVWGDYNMPDPKSCAYFTMAREYLKFEPSDETDGTERIPIRCDK